MKAVIFETPGEADVMQWKQTDIDVTNGSPKPKHVFIKVFATAVNRADTLQRRGKYPPPAGASDILGLECSGVVHAVGENVENVQIGDRVCALLSGGGHAEFVEAHSQQCMKLPDSIDFQTAAAIPESFLTGFQALNVVGNLELENSQQTQKTVLIHAAGSALGLSMIQLIRCAKTTANHVIVATAGSDEKLLACRKLGANLTVNRHECQFEQAMEQKGLTADLIIDCVGADYFEKNISVLARDGTLVSLGLLSGRETKQPVNLGELLKKRASLKFTTLRTRSDAYKADLVERFWSFAREAFVTARIKPVIHVTLPIEQIVEAHQIMERNENTGKIVLQIVSKKRKI